MVTIDYDTIDHATILKKIYTRTLKAILVALGSRFEKPHYEELTTPAVASFAEYYFKFKKI